MKLASIRNKSIYISIALTIYAVISFFLFDGSLGWIFRLMNVENPFVSISISDGSWDPYLFLALQTFFFLIPIWNNKSKDNSLKKLAEYSMDVKIFYAISGIYLFIVYLLLFVMLILTSL
jgi:hypothetical protein